MSGDRDLLAPHSGTAALQGRGMTLQLPLGAEQQAWLTVCNAAPGSPLATWLIT